eukprot:GHVS01064798.1.p1 GENE.GHVS01064798.1~~GHVS01064798.1.p1  ORF type:complete len:407 (+),score=31.92 GHVS01064798.1:46-1221(+)
MEPWYATVSAEGPAVCFDPSEYGGAILQLRGISVSNADKPTTLYVALSEQGNRERHPGQKVDPSFCAKQKNAIPEEEATKKSWVLANFGEGSKTCRSFPTRLVLTKPLLFRTKTFGHTMDSTEGVKATSKGDSVTVVHLFGVVLHRQCQGCCHHHPNQSDNNSKQGHKGRKRLLDSDSRKPDSKVRRSAEPADCSSPNQASWKSQIQPIYAVSTSELPPSLGSQLSLSNNNRNGSGTDSTDNVVKRSPASSLSRRSQASTSQARSCVPPASGNAWQLGRLRLKGGVVAEVVQTPSKQGCGKSEVTRGSRIRVNYVGRLAQNGKKFDSGMLKMRVGSGDVIPGMDVGVAGMKEGERRKILIPSAMGYGKRGAPPCIPGGADLVFEVTLVKIE